MQSLSGIERCTILHYLSVSTNELEYAEMYKNQVQATPDFDSQVFFLNHKENVLVDLRFMDNFLKLFMARGKPALNQVISVYEVKYLPNVSQKLLALYFTPYALICVNNKPYRHLEYERFLRDLQCIMNHMQKQTGNEKFTLRFVLYYVVYMLKSWYLPGFTKTKKVFSCFADIFGTDGLDVRLILRKLSDKYNGIRVSLTQVFGDIGPGEGKYPSGCFD